MVLITILTGVYKPTYNWGAPLCLYIYIYCGGTTLHLKVQMGSFLARMAKRSLRTDKCHVNPKLDKWHASTLIKIFKFTGHTRFPSGYNANQGEVQVK